MEAVLQDPQPACTFSSASQPGQALKTLCVVGWRGFNHSIAMVNQNQLLEMVKDARFQLLHRDAPFYLPHWERSKLTSVFLPEEMALIDGPPDPGDQTMNVCLRIASPVRLGTPGSARRNVTFVVTEFGLSERSFDPPTLRPEQLTQGDDFVVTPAQWSRARLMEHGFASDKIAVIPHGYKTDAFMPMNVADREQARRNLGLPPQEPCSATSVWRPGTRASMCCCLPLPNCACAACRCVSS